jgi:uncharacterized protein (DUF2147 family)
MHRCAIGWIRAALAILALSNLVLAASVAYAATPSPGTLLGVSCVNAGFCEAVGQAYIAGVSQAIAEGWSGSTKTWTSQPINGAPNSGFGGVSCPALNVCTAVGWYNGSPQATLAARLNGSTWQIQATPNPISGGKLLGVACPAINLCVAVGSLTRANALIERWNGTAWHIQPTPNLQTSGVLLKGVVCRSGSDCTAVGAFNQGGTTRTLAEHWNGTSWSVEATPNPTSGGPILSGVACFTGGCLAVGQTNPASEAGRINPLVEGWNGTSWTIKTFSAAATDAALSGISCFTNSTACEAVGWIGGVGRAPLAAGWNGSAWTNQTTVSPGGDTVLEAISCATVVCTAVGFTGSTTLAERWNGTAWHIQTTS